MRSQPRLLWLVPALLVAACGSDGGTSVVDDAGFDDDTGKVAVKDAGNPTTDNGRVDSGRADTGTPTQDTGTPTDDTGKVVDGGSPTDDLGGPTDDLGGPTDDTGAAVDVGSPTDDTGAAIDGGSPTDDTGAAVDGGSTCPTGQSACGASCVDLQTDNTNCGTCSTSCPTGQSCQAGTCRTACGAGQTLCGTTCVTLDSDPTNCGACAHACPTGQMCAAGVCALSCAAPRTLCTGTGGAMSCADTLTDAANCGTCGNACATGQSCVAGTCRLVCPAGQTACGGACVDTNSSNANCGSCGTACPTGQSCAVGACVRDCAATETRCGDACINTQTSAANCGACGHACAAGQTCAAGVCACATGQTLCGTACLDLRTDAANCGTCAHACAAGQACTAGACAAGAPANDLPAGATAISTTAPAQTITGSTIGSANNSGCGVGGDVYYRFTLAARELVYADTFGSGFDTQLAFTPTTGASTVTATCTDDSCGVLQSQLVRTLDAGTYYLIVSGYNATGAFTLHFQHLPVGNGAVTQITSTAAGTQTFMGTTAGTGAVTETCRPATGPDNTYWIATCPSFAATQFNGSTCGGATWDTVLEQRSASRTDNVCDDDSCSVQSTVAGTLPAGAGLHTLTVDGYNATSLGAYTLTLTLGTCPTGQNFCGSTCTDLRTSASNCGGCGTVCAAPTGGSTSCVASVCTPACPTGQSNCSNVCRATLTDVNNCGGCGTVCAAQTGGSVSCAAGACVRTCPAGQSNCSNTCRTLTNDNNNCGACGTVCAAGNTCAAGVCRPANDALASATALTLTAGETTVTGSTTAATFDGPTGCGDGVGNVWYRVTLAAPEVLYADTAGSGYDTRLYLASSATALVANTCSDDAGCTTGGFTLGTQSRFAVDLAAGTYYIGVSGFNAGTVGAFTLHVQHIPHSVGSFFYAPAITGTANVADHLVGTSAHTPTCGPGPSGEDVRWMLSCGGAAASLFSLCQSDGGSFVRLSGGVTYDPMMSIYGAQTGTEVQCNDDGNTAGGTNCAGTGTGADTAQYGSRISAALPRGISAVIVDERTQTASGLQYTLHYNVQ